VKKIVIALLVIFVIGGGFVYMGLSGLDGFIREQIETQGSQVTKTKVTVTEVKTKLSDAKASISGIKIANPQGYSTDSAFSLGTVKLDIGSAIQEPYVIEEILIDSPAVLYEVDKQGKANLTVIQENIQSALPQSDAQPVEQGSDKAAPLMSVNKITVKDVKLKLNIEAVDLGELPLEKRIYELTLPTFHTDAIGVPNGIPADQLGAAIVDSMLDNLIKEGKDKVKEIVEEQAKAKVKEKLDKEKDKLKQKAKDKLKDLFNR